MKILKKQGLTLMLIAALVVTLTLGIIFMLPAKTAKADDDVFQGAATVEVSTEQQLKDEVTKAGTTATKIVLKNDIEMNSVSSVEGRKYFELIISRGQKIQLDLAGHKLSVSLNPSSNYVIVNYGTLSIIDSSGDYSGKVLSNGVIEYSRWYHASVINNYGDLTLNANVGLERPESKGNPGDDGYYSGISSRGQSMIISSLYIPGADDADQTISNSSVTVEGGTFSGEYGDVFEIIDANLTINDGKFITSPYTTDGNRNNVYLFAIRAYTRDPYYPKYYVDDEDVGHLYEGEQEKVDAELKLQKELIEKLKDHRHSDVQIKGGDFTQYISATLTVSTKIEYCTSFEMDDWGGEYTRGKAGDSEASIAITGGRWGIDLSAYVADGYWMELYQETTQEGEILTKFYQVSRIEEDRAGALLEANGEECYYASFTSALSAAKKMQADTRTITLLADNQISSIGLTDLTGELRLDLNGHKLTVEPSVGSAHFTGGDESAHRNSFVICDRSDRHDGELILSVKSLRNEKFDSSFIEVSQYTKFVLESGTIRQTGYVPEEYYDTSDSSYSRKCNQLALFKLADYVMINDSNVDEYAGCVQIKGGNILSDLTFGTEENVVGHRAGELFAWKNSDVYQNHTYECGLGEGGEVSVANKTKIFVVDLGEYLSDSTTVCKFSWDFNDIVSVKDLTSSSDGNGNYIVSKVSENEYFIVGSKKVANLQDALKEAKRNDTISVLQDATVTDAVEIGNGITLNLNSVANFNLTFEKGVTFTDGASVRYGNLVSKGAVTVAGNTTFDSVTLDGNVTVSGGTLTILSGTYNGEFTISGGKMAISGGSFKGSEIEKIDQYFGRYLGALDENNGYDYENNLEKLYTVKFGPNRTAQAWYEKYKDAEDKTFCIATTSEWDAFALYANLGLETFYGKTVKLSDSLNFGGTPSGTALLKASQTESNFLPVGNAAHPFMGSFDGKEYEISGIVAREKAVGLIGYAKNPSETVTVVKNVTVKDSVFTVGNGYLDEFNTGLGYFSGGAIIGESHFGTTQEKIVINNVTVNCEINGGMVYSGAIVGHSWGNVTVDGLTMSDATLKANWKLGGVVGFTEGSVVIKKSTITDITLEGSLSEPGVVAGHLSHKDSKNVIEDCVINTPDLDLIGSGVAGDKTITIDGPETYINVHALTGDDSAVGIEFSSEVTEEGVKRTTVITHSADDNVTFTDEEGNELDVTIGEDGGFDAATPLDVTIGKIAVPAMTYSATEAKEATLTSFVLYNELGNMLDNEEYQYLKNLTVVVTLQLSKSTVGKQMALITSYTITGADANKYTFQLTGNQTFIEVEVTAKTLQVSVNGEGEVEYNGFVGGEDESVLGGTLTLDKVDNGDGTYTVTPSGLESENYNIVYVSSVVPAAAFETESNALWIALAVVGSAVLLLAAFAVVYAVRKRKE